MEIRIAKTRRILTSSNSASPCHGPLTQPVAYPAPSHLLTEEVSYRALRYCFGRNYMACFILVRPLLHNSKVRYPRRRKTQRNMLLASIPLSTTLGSRSPTPGPRVSLKSLRAKRRSLLAIRFVELFFTVAQHKGNYTIPRNTTTPASPARGMWRGFRFLEAWTTNLRSVMRTPRNSVLPGVLHCALRAFDNIARGTFA